MNKIKQLVDEMTWNGDKVHSYPEQFDWIGQGRSAVAYKIEKTNQVVKVFYPKYKHLAQIEADVYRRLSNHDLFPELYDVGDGFLVLEYVAGQTLYDCLIQGVSITEEMVEQVDLAMQYARSQGLNPSDTHLKNILLTEEGAIKVIDVVRFTQEEECPHWDDLKKAYFSYYQKRYFPRKFPKFFIEFVIRLYRKRLLPI
ncbi:serine/threonine protein kinase [Halobacillus locisalis]|uniref:Serine/threonine protein kinase n=1 Tax=Halobacillus locisalis TaxID=220753 RepID=A0A838CUX2_9BACI|nr:serine/threonine protein kinase [Halobacillus locisalis]MBA2175703.1 serine/threonine protein kinase [Halobacillus locisalis]